MMVTDLQAVLDRLVDIYADLSPQILRSAVEYAKFQAESPALDTDDGTGGKTPLLIWTQGYVEGYCHIFDGYYNPDAVDVATNEYTEDIIAGIIEHYGEESPTSIISACADFANVIASKRHPDTSDADIAEVVRLSSIGYMDGALDAADDVTGGKRVRSMSNGYGMDAAEIAYDIVSDEIRLAIDDEDASWTLKTSACTCLCDMMDILVYPRSGNGDIATEDPLICAMLYLLGYLKGVTGGRCSSNDDGHGGDSGMADKDECSKTTSSSEGGKRPGESERLVEKSLIAMWCRYSGYPPCIFEDACDAMASEVLGDEQPEEIEDGDDSMLAVLYGVGYADGAWMSSQDDGIDERELIEMEISEEIDRVFADMDVRP